MQRGLLALLLAAPACGTSPQTVQLREAVAAAGAPPAAAAAFRLPERRGAPRSYQLPSLTETGARQEVGPGVDHVIGLGGDDNLLYALAGGKLVALDLTTGRFRTLDSNVTDASLSPAGAVRLRHADGTLASAVERRIAPVGALPANARLELLFAAPDDRTVAIVRSDSGRQLLLLNGGTVTERRPLPDGALAATRWGDAVAVAGPDDLVVVELMRTTPPLRIRLRALIQALTFSASGHRLYAATDAGEILVFERYEGDAIARVATPAPVTALRADPFGRYVFGAAGRTVVVLDAGDSVVAAPSGPWADDLPTAGPDGTILLRRGGDVIALHPPDSVARARVAGSARDRWLVAPWGAEPARLPAAVATANAGPVAEGVEIFVQVSSTSNAQWAEGLASDLRQAGMRASVLAPTTADEMYRVVLGPYATRDQAETIGRKLGMPYWIFQRDTTGGTTP